VEAGAGRAVGGGLLEEVCLVLDLMSAVAEDIDDGGTHAVVFCYEKVFEENLIDLVEAPGDPEGFEEVVLVAR